MRLSDNTNNEALAKTKLNIVFYAQTQPYVNYNAHRNFATSLSTAITFTEKIWSGM